MAGFTHSEGVTYKNDAGTITSTTNLYTGDLEHNFDLAVPVSTTNFPTAIAFAQNKIVSFVLFADQALTVKTNSTTTPQETIALAKGQQIVWTTAHLEDCPFSADVTNIYLTNASSSVVANFKFRMLLLV